MTSYGEGQLIIGALVVFNFGFILGMHFGFQFRTFLDAKMKDLRSLIND